MSGCILRFQRAMRKEFKPRLPQIEALIWTLLDLPLALS